VVGLVRQRLLNAAGSATESAQCGMLLSWCLLPMHIVIKKLRTNRCFV
jgi:hypothetical protein